MDKKEALQQIADKKAEIAALLSECEALADEAGVTFSFNPSGAYGAGATYMGATSEDVTWYESEYDYEEGQGMWRSSSQSC